MPGRPGLKLMLASLSIADSNRVLGWLRGVDDLRKYVVGAAQALVTTRPDLLRLVSRSPDSGHVLQFDRTAVDKEKRAVVSQKASGDAMILRSAVRKGSFDEDLDGPKSLMRELAASGNRRLVIDLVEVECSAVNVSGLLMQAHTIHCQCGGRVAACGAGKGLRNFLRLAKLDTVVDFFETEAEAIASFAQR